MTAEAAPLFFLLGNPRSGTSLLRLMLNAHPAIVMPPECGFAMWLRNRYADLDLSDPAVISRYAADVSASRKFETWQMPEDWLRDRLLRDAYSRYPQIAREIYAAYAERLGRHPRLLGDKNNYYIAMAERIAQAFPDSPIIHLVRDGRDVACSYLDLADREIASEYRPRLAADISQIAREWSENCMRMARLTGPRTHLVRYEDLLASPEAELSRICEFLGETFDPVMLEFYRRNDEPEDFLQWKAKTKEPLDPANTERFREALSKAQIAAFESVASEALRRFGYELSSGDKSV